MNVWMTENIPPCQYFYRYILQVAFCFHHQIRVRCSPRLELHAGQPKVMGMAPLCIDLEGSLFLDLDPQLQAAPSFKT